MPGLVRPSSATSSCCLELGPWEVRVFRLSSGRLDRREGRGSVALPSRRRGRGLSSAAETAIVVGPSALELLTILSIASPLEFGWHAATVVALLLRRRWPVLVLVATLPVAFSGYLLLAPMAALYQVARQVGGPRVLACCALLVFAAGLGPWLPTEEEPFSYEDALFGVLSAAMLTAGPVAIGRLVRTRVELSERIAELARTQERERQLLAERAVAEERARLAREMHDMVSHQVSMISMQAGALQMSSAEPDSQEIGRKIHRLSRVTLDELRHLVGVLRTARERPALPELAALVGSSGLDVELRREDLGSEHQGDDGEGGWPEVVGESAYRTVQEALTNVRKYAPDSNVRVTLSTADSAGGAAGSDAAAAGDTTGAEGTTAGGAARAPAAPADASATGPYAPYSGPALVVEVHNTRPSRSPRHQLPTGGYGLTGLRERAELLGGTLRASRTEDGGFLVRAVLPAARAGGASEGSAADGAGTQLPRPAGPSSPAAPKPPASAPSPPADAAPR